MEDIARAPSPGPMCCIHPPYLWNMSMSTIAAGTIALSMCSKSSRQTGRGQGARGHAPSGSSRWYTTLSLLCSTLDVSLARACDHCGDSVSQSECVGKSIRLKLRSPPTVPIQVTD
jgi:hypothetical protein